MADGGKGKGGGHGLGGTVWWSGGRSATIYFVSTYHYHYFQGNECILSSHKRHA